MPRKNAKYRHDQTKSETTTRFQDLTYFFLPRTENPFRERNLPLSHGSRHLGLHFLCGMAGWAIHAGQARPSSLSYPWVTEVNEHKSH